MSYVQDVERLPEELKHQVHQMDLYIWAWHKLGDVHLQQARNTCIDVLRRLDNKEELSWLYRITYTNLDMLYRKYPSNRVVGEYAAWIERQQRKRDSVWWALYYSLVGD